MWERRPDPHLDLSGEANTPIMSTSCLEYSADTISCESTEPRHQLPATAFKTRWVHAFMDQGQLIYTCLAGNHMTITWLHVPLLNNAEVSGNWSKAAIEGVVIQPHTVCVSWNQRNEILRKTHSFRDDDVWDLAYSIFCCSEEKVMFSFPV